MAHLFHIIGRPDREYDDHVFAYEAFAERHFDAHVSAFFANCRCRNHAAFLLRQSRKNRGCVHLLRADLDAAERRVSRGGWRITDERTGQFLEAA